MNLILQDWQEVWLRDCFWHMLFVIILGIVMILWRPSSNRVRYGSHSMCSLVPRPPPIFPSGYETIVCGSL